MDCHTEKSSVEFQGGNVGSESTSDCQQISDSQEPFQNPMMRMSETLQQLEQVGAEQTSILLKWRKSDKISQLGTLQESTDSMFKAIDLLEMASSKFTRYLDDQSAAAKPRRTHDGKGSTVMLLSKENDQVKSHQQSLRKDDCGDSDGDSASSEYETEKVPITGRPITPRKPQHSASNCKGLDSSGLLEESTKSLLSASGSESIDEDVSPETHLGSTDEPEPRPLFELVELAGVRCTEASDPDELSLQQQEDRGRANRLSAEPGSGTNSVLPLGRPNEPCSTLENHTGPLLSPPGAFEANEHDFFSKTHVPLPDSPDEGAALACAMSPSRSLPTAPIERGPEGERGRFSEEPSAQAPQPSLSSHFTSDSKQESASHEEDPSPSSSLLPANLSPPSIRVEETITSCNGDNADLDGALLNALLTPPPDHVPYLPVEVTSHSTLQECSCSSFSAVSPEWTLRSDG